MASLTPGVLLKLLQSMDSDRKVTGEHRSAVLQVIGIVPALSASTADDLWPSHGFYLQLSDSVHSTYVSLSTHDADSVLSTHAQLGQLVHVDRFISSSPVPKAEGLRPVPSSRPHPFIGFPEQLVVHSSPTGQGFVIQPASPTRQAPPLLPSSNSKRSTALAQKENLVTPQADKAKAPVRRRSSSPATGKFPIPSNANASSKRAASPAVRSVSPIPSKCVVPSLVAAKEENRRSAKEPAIVVPSRYRQPSPVSRKGAASPAAVRRASVSPGRRLSGVMKMSPAVGAADGVGVGVGVGKKRVGLVVAGMPKVSDAILGSAKSVRKSWDWDDSSSSIGSVQVSIEGKTKTKGKGKVTREAILKTQVAMSRRLSDVTVSNDHQSSTDDKKSEAEAQKKKSSGSGGEKTKPKISISIHDRKWTDGSVPLNAVSDSLAKRAKEALQRRDVASTVAAEALQEALVTEAILRNFSKFSDLCNSSKPTIPIPTIDLFLTIYTDLQKWQNTIHSLCEEAKPDISLLESSSLWVEAALATDLQVVPFVHSALDSISKPNNNNKFTHKSPASASVDQPRTSLSKRQQPLSTTSGSKGNSKNGPNPTSNSWSSNSGFNQTLELSQVVRSEMQTWFLKFVDDALDVGFILIGEKDRISGKNGKVTVVLSEFKKINDWLDGIGKLPEEEALMEKIEMLKRKIYGFVISHMGSALGGSVSISE